MARPVQEDDPEVDREGDVLILDPKLPLDHVPTFDFGKIAGRGGDDYFDSDNERDEIVIFPNEDFIRKKV